MFFRRADKSHLIALLSLVSGYDEFWIELNGRSLDELVDEVGFLQEELMGIKQQLGNIQFDDSFLEGATKDGKTLFFTGLPNHATFLWRIQYCSSVLPISMTLTPASIHWLEKEEIVRNLPKVIKQIYRKCRVIIDCCNVFTERLDEVPACGAQLTIPTFTRGKSQLSPKEIETGRRLSRLRIHLERAIERVKIPRFSPRP
ncbi:hypothetical protein LSH36_46g07088 [Paralvinella palmiformis]|uniref:DDE Tnp4 domain-containing protein n=1 Tax=Paralvinella palmiformis TaxID=53620 RepID=A0AAD9NEV2_9ANNE|nr:hypothetical protein LSH36_46g07088 [Paralvinella palmiformis]